jgi:hypothetical protein
MSAVFNLVIIGLVLLIAYWWANQGFFSALLHLVCVIAAGAIALAIWEPLVVGLLLRGNPFDNYAWGVGLILPFVLVLLVMRVILDKSVGANVDLPRWANLTFGMILGLASGILTIGILVIGAGFIQSHPKVMGFVGYARSGRDGKVDENQQMWLPVHKLTYQFYSYLSAGALYPNFNDTPLNRVYPALDQVAMSLHRDSFNNGRGRTSLGPDDARVERVLLCDNCSPRRIAVEVVFEAGARDFGEQLTISSSQIRLIGNPTGDFTDAKVAHPVEYTQYSGHHRFDDMTHYITSEPAQSQAQAIIEFNANDLGSQQPRYIQIKGTRFRLPRPGTEQWQPLDAETYATQLRGTGASVARSGITLADTTTDISTVIRVANDIRPIQMSMNRKPSGLEITRADDKNWISGGEAEFTSSGDRPGRGLEVAGILEPRGTKIVQVEVMRSGPANLWRDDLATLINSSNPVVQLVDTQGRGYVPIGFIQKMPGGKWRIKVDSQNYVKTMNELPTLPSADTHQLKLLFSVTEGATISGLKLGDATLGRCNVPVTGKAGSTAPAAGGAPGPG